MKKSITSTRTASWQYDSMELAEGMDNKNHPGYKKPSKYSGNQSGLKAIETGKRGPTKGNDGMCCDPLGSAPRGKTPPSHVHDTHAPGAYGKAPYRGQGGTVVKTGRESFDFGRGPTKGNQQ